MQWIDTHCHLDAPEFGDSVDGIRTEARQQGVGLCVIPAVERSAFSGARDLAARHGDAYALGIHPLYVPNALNEDLQALDEALNKALDDGRHDPRLVAVGEIGLDYFVPSLGTPDMRKRQWHFYVEQLRLAKRHGLPVILHVRRSADMLLKGLREVGVSGGIAHAFNGSEQQAKAFIDLGFCLGFGGACTYDRAQNLRRLATSLPAESIVLETDSPDMPPHWLYVTAEARASGQVQSLNTPAQLPRIAEVVAGLRGVSIAELALQTTRNAMRVLPRLAALVLTEGVA